MKYKFSKTYRLSNTVVCRSELNINYIEQDIFEHYRPVKNCIKTCRLVIETEVVDPNATQLHDISYRSGADFYLRIFSFVINKNAYEKYKNSSHNRKQTICLLNRKYPKEIILPILRTAGV
jgi:hypothetical protein